MAEKLAALIVCPGRGTYGKNELGYLQRFHADKADLVAMADRLRAASNACSRGEPRWRRAT